MALIKRDRSFDDILSDVIMKELPLKFISNIHVHLTNGGVVEFGRDELEGIDEIDTLLASEVMDEYREMILDIQVTMDSDLIKRSVNGHVTSLLARHFGDTAEK